MASDAAKLLDELMGRDRNLAPTESRKKIRWDDEEVCRYFLCGFCPHDLFVNTRADLGQCEKIHDDELKKNYEASSRHGSMGYEQEFYRFLQSLLSDVERRIRRGQGRLQLNSQQGNVSENMQSGPQATREEKVQMLTNRINELVEQAEELGCEGKVAEAQGVMKLVDQLTEERTQVDQQLKQQLPVQYNENGTRKDMEVCEICGALLVIGDVQQRIDEHLMGKQHMGYARIRAQLEKLKTEQENKILVKDSRYPSHLQRKVRGEDAEKLAREREEREKEREKEREERKKRREEEEKKRRSRSRSRSRRHKRSRSRSRSRRHRSRSGSRHRRRHSSRDRHRERRRSRSRGSRKSSRRERSRSSSRREKRSSKSKEKDGDRESRKSEDKPQPDSSSATEPTAAPVDNGVPEETEPTEAPAPTMDMQGDSN